MAILFKLVSFFGGKGGASVVGILSLLMVGSSVKDWWDDRSVARQHSREISALEEIIEAADEKRLSLEHELDATVRSNDAISATLANFEQAAVEAEAYAEAQRIQREQLRERNLELREAINRIDEDHRNELESVYENFEEFAATGVPDDVVSVLCNYLREAGAIGQSEICPSADPNGMPRAGPEADRAAAVPATLVWHEVP